MLGGTSFLTNHSTIIVNMASLIPLPGYVLVQLTGSYGIATPNEKYNLATDGICITVPQGDPTYEMAEGKRIFWEEYNASKRIEKDGKVYCFIRLEDVRGWEEAI